MQPSGSVAKWDGDKLTVVGHGPGNLSGARVARRGAGHRRLEDPLHQQVERFHVRRGAHGRGAILSDDRAPGEGDRPAGEGHAAEGSGTGATPDQAGDHHEVQSRREERRPHRRHRSRSVRERRRSGIRRARRRSGQRLPTSWSFTRRKFRTGDPRGAPIARTRRAPGHRAATSSRKPSGLGKHDRRNGGRFRNRSRSVPH